jgi:hypothetical protein
MGQVILVVLVTVTMLTGCAAIAVAPRKVRTRPSQRRASRRLRGEPTRRASAARAPGPNAVTLMRVP